jgi:hypothetical protein
MTAEEVDRLIDERPGKELLAPVYDDPAHRLTDFLYRSGGATAGYMLVSDGARVIVNTGLGYEAPHHKRVFDAVCPGPTPYIVTTQAHVDHVGGVGLFREPDTRYVAQANNQACQHDDARIAALRLQTAGHLVRRERSPGPGDRRPRTPVSPCARTSPSPTSPSMTVSSSTSVELRARAPVHARRRDHRQLRRLVARNTGPV